LLVGLDGAKPSAISLRGRSRELPNAEGIGNMPYDANTVAMLCTVLDELLASEPFMRQNSRSAVQVAEYVLGFAQQGERDPENIKQGVLRALLGCAAA
jgi:hypothetical protein